MKLPAFKLNLDRLHDPRQSGETTRMLVNAIINSEFLNDPNDVVYVVATTSYKAKVISEMAWNVATVMGYKTRRVGPACLAINEIYYEFIAAVSLGRIKNKNSVVFKDHSVIKSELGSVPLGRPVRVRGSS